MEMTAMRDHRKEMFTEMSVVLVTLASLAVVLLIFD
jgi:hypothetical protein